MGKTDIKTENRLTFRSSRRKLLYLRFCDWTPLPWVLGTLIAPRIVIAERAQDLRASSSAQPFEQKTFR
jgi:hypothetical protein